MGLGIGIHNTPGSHYVVLPQAVHAAATATEERALIFFSQAVKIIGMTLINDAAVTGNDTNRTNLNFKDRGTDGLGTTEKANFDLATGTNLVAYLGKAVTITAWTQAAASAIGLEYEKVGTGLAVTCTIVLEFQYV